MPDAADADDFAREVDQLELLEQHAPVVLERCTIGAQELVQRIEHLVAFDALREFVDRHDQGRFGRRYAPRPSTSRVSLENADMLSLVRALASASRSA